MIPSHASLLDGNWGWEYGAILSPRNVSMETGLLTVMDKLIKHSSNRNPNQSLSQWLTAAVLSPCNQPGNCFTWSCFAGTGRLGSAAFTELDEFQRKLFYITDRNFNPPHRFLWLFYWVKFSLVRKWRLTEVTLPNHVAIMYHDQIQANSVLHWSAYL